MLKYRIPLQWVLLSVVLLLGSIAAGLYRPEATYTQQSIEPDVSNWPQQSGNWCGPAVLQAAIDWAWYNFNGTHRMFSQQTLWNTMKNNIAFDLLGYGRNAALPGTVGDGTNEVRKLNIAYDFGVDPHALAWMMRYYTTTGFYYHYWVYDNVTDATRWLLWTVEKYHEGVPAAVANGSHWVLVIGYEADNPAYPSYPGLGTIYRVRYANPLLTPGYAKQWVSYSTGSGAWTSYFTPYTDIRDPEPSTGWYITPPNHASPTHWYNKWVTVERDTQLSYNPDWGMKLNGPTIAHQALTYLPDIRTGNGWNTTIVIRNNGSSTANATITYYDTAGRPVNTLPSTAVSANGSLTANPPGNFGGSAVVAATQDVSVVVNTEASTQSASYNGVSASGGDPGLRIGQTIYAPLSLARWPGGWHTTITVQNTGSSSASIGITYYAASGTAYGPYTASLSPNASQSFDANSHLSFAFAGSAKVTSTQDIAVVVSESNGAMTGTYNGVSAGAKTIRVPLILKGWDNGWTTGLQIQNLESAAASVTLNYYNDDGTQAGTQGVGILGLGNATFTPNVPNAWAGVAVLTSDWNVAMEIDEYNPNTGDLQSYTGVGWASSVAYLPDVRNSATFGTGIIIQNTGGAASSVVVLVNGTQTWSGSIPVNGFQSLGLAHIPASGQAVVQSTNGQGLVVELDNYWETAGDGLMSYLGINR